MYKLTDYVTEVQITGVDPVYGPDGEPTMYGAGSMLVTYNNGPQSRFALRPSTANKGLLARAVKLTARGCVLDAIEKMQRFKDGEPAWLQAVKQETAKAQKAKEQQARIAAWQTANPIR